MAWNHPRAFVLGAVALLVSACAGPGGGITDRIRAANSPIIQKVQFSPSNMFGHPEEIFVFVVSNATDGEVRDAWCNIVVPAGIDRLPAERVGLRRSGTADPSDIDLGSSNLSKPHCP